MDDPINLFNVMMRKEPQEKEGKKKEELHICTYVCMYVCMYNVDIHCIVFWALAIHTCMYVCMYNVDIYVV